MTVPHRPVQEYRFTWTKDNSGRLAKPRKDARLPPDPPLAEPREPQIDMGGLVRAIRRQVPLIAVCAGVGILGAVLMILGSVPRYTAVETVLLDEERADLLNAISPLPNAVRSDTAVRSEIEIIHSRALAYRVVDMLELDQDADFLSPPVGATQRVTGAIGALTDPLARLLTPGPRAPSPSPGTGGPAAAAPAPLFDLRTTDRDRAAGLLRDRVSASRAGRSLVIRIGYTGFDPTRAAMIARGYGTAYESFQLQTSTEVAGTAEAWLRARIGVMEERSIAAAAAVQEFRAANGLVEARGSLLTEQQQSELASALVAAAANAAEAEAQLESMEALLARARGGEEVIGVPLADGPVRGTIEEFRRTYLDARLRYGRLVDRFGADHPQALELADTIEDVRGAIQVELEQATEAARVAYAVARSREDSLQSDLAATTGPSADGVTLRGRLLQLEAISETYAQLYRDYLARLEVTMQQQGFPIAAVKILSPAEVPKGASSPRKKAMLLAGMLLGGFVGVMIGAGRELLPKPVRTASALRDEVGVRCAGLLPGSGQDAARARTLDRLVQACEGEEEEGGRIVALAPLTAPLPEEETLPMELGERLSDGGARRVLVLYDDTPDRVPADPPVEALSLQMLLGSIAPQRPSGAPDFEALGEELRARYAFVVLAMQPIAGARRADAHSWAYDATVLRVPWGRVLPGFVSDALRDHPAFRARLVTTVLEGAHLPTARKYMSPGSYEERQTYA